MHLITIAFMSGENITKLVDSVGEDVKAITIHVNSKSDEVMAACERVRDRYGAQIVPHGYNRGCSACWNDSIIASYNEGLTPLIVNDDVWFSPGDVAKIAKMVADSPKAGVVTVAGPHIGHGKRLDSHGYSCFAMTRHAIETVGLFDENIFPAYLEDCDWSYRSKLLGLSEANCLDTDVSHYGSFAIRTSHAVQALNGFSHRLNFEYYRRKWGGINGEEVFETPFNQGWPLKIEFARRRSPYGPDNDRVDKPYDIRVTDTQR